MISIPPAIILGAAINILLYLFEVNFNTLPAGVTATRDVLLVLFFICVGLSIVIREIGSVLWRVFWVTVATVVLIIGQNFAGATLSTWFGQSPQIGVLLGSVSFVGGLGSAVAWGAVLEQQGFAHATSLGIAGAMVGMIMGALLAGPLGVWWAKAAPQISKESTGSVSIVDTLEIDFGESGHDQGSLRLLAVPWSQWLAALVVVGVTYFGGMALQQLLRSLDIVFPSFLTAMIVAVVVTVCAPEHFKAYWRSVVIALEPLILNAFLLITFATLNVAALKGMGAQVLVTSIVQVIFTVFIAWILVYIPLMRRVGASKTDGDMQYARGEAAATSAAVIGYGLASLSVAMAVLRRMQLLVHPVPLARQTIAVTGAALVDVLNAIGIAVSLWLASS